MLQLQNDTPFTAAIAVLPDRAGVDTLHVLIKATVTLRPTLSLADAQIPPTLADEYFGEPDVSSLKHASEMHIGKPGTDVLLIGSAWAREKTPVTRMEVTMWVAGRQKTILVTGNRVWRNGQPSDPEPFESMPLVWERAFGGVHQNGDRVLAEERNPIGQGFAGDRPAADMQGLALPNLEDPASLLQQAGQRSTPVCFAPVAASWLPRRALAGTYDEAWQRKRAPYLPDDFDSRFFQCAPPEFAFDRFVKAGEQVHVNGVLPDGPIAFSVPDPRLKITVAIAGSTASPRAHLETLSIEPDDNRACFTWRASVACDRKALKIGKVAIRRAGGRP